MSRLSRRVTVHVQGRRWLCLSTQFERAFERGLLTIDEELRIVVAHRLREELADWRFVCSLLEVHGAELLPPTRFAPDQAALAYHREQEFRER